MGRSSYSSYVGNQKDITKNPMTKKQQQLLAKTNNSLEKREKKM